MADASKRTEKREKYLQRTYGISLAQFDSILKSQGGGCAICGRKSDGKRSLAVEHNHKNLEIRGVCCSYCNHRLIGRHTDPELLRRIADYLSQGTGLFVPEKKKKKKKRKRRVRRR